MKKTRLSQFDDFSLVSDGLLFRSLARMGLVRPGPKVVYWIAVVVALLTWLPLVALSASLGMALGDAVKVPFLQDFTVSIRLLLALPLLIVAELVFHARSDDVVNHFVDAGLVTEADVPRFGVIARQTEALSSSSSAQVLLLVLVVLSSFLLPLEFSGASTWQFLRSPSGITRTPAGWWYFVVSIPVFRFLLGCWLWRYLAWCWFLWRVSRLDLQLVSTHPDRVAGLAFLGVVQRKFCILIIAWSSILSAHVGQEILFGGASPQQYTMMILGNVALMLGIFLGPLFFYSVKLFDAQRRGFLAYSALANEYTQTFERKWIKGEAPEGEPLIGSSDIQSLADLGNSFGVVRDMGFVPFDLRLTIIPIAASAIVPFLPLALTVLPLDEIVRKILGILL
jgi:hypothetical protein